MTRDRCSIIWGTRIVPLAAFFGLGTIKGALVFAAGSSRLQRHLAHCAIRRTRAGPIQIVLKGLNTGRRRASPTVLVDLCCFAFGVEVAATLAEPHSPFT
jgi:hypothetical protein